MIQFYDRAVIDTPIWIGSKSERDQYNKPSIKIINAFLEGKIKKVYLTNYILVELVNFLLKKLGYDFALDVLESIKSSDKIEIIFIDEIMDIEINNIFRKYKRLSTTDCSIIYIMQKEKINYLFSFDSNFDSVKGIIRLGDI